MKFGMSTLGCPGWTLERVAAEARDYGYAGVDLRLLDDEVITPAMVRANRGRIERLFGAGNPEIIGLGTSVRLSTANPEERAANERDLLEYIALAQDLGIPMVRVFGGRIPEGDDLESAIRRSADVLRRGAPAAERQNVTIALETHDDFCHSARVAAILADVPSPAVGALWDVHHPFRMGDSVEDVWQNLGERLVHVHLKDALRTPDGRGQLVLLGEGEVPCREIMQSLVARDYTGYVVMEWEKKWHPEIADPEVAFPQHLKVARTWLKEMAG